MGKATKTKTRKVFYKGEKEVGKGCSSFLLGSVRFMLDVRAPPSGLSTSF